MVDCIRVYTYGFSDGCEHGYGLLLLLFLKEYLQWGLVS